MSDNIQEAEVGSGTKVADTKQSEKRAQLTLKAIQLRLKQEKERAALQQQKKSLSVKEDIGESFSPSQIAALKAEYSKINGIDPASDTYKKLIAMLDRLDLKSLQSLAGAEIKFVSKLAQNRVLRKSMKKEDVQLDENEDLANARKMYHKHFVAAMKAMPSSIVQKRHQDEMEKYKKIMGNSFIDQVAPSKFAKFDKKIKEEVESIDEQHSVLYKMKKSEPKIAVAHYKSKDDADKFLASVKEKGGNGVVRVGKIGLDLTPRDKKESINEKSAYEIYHKDYSSAVQTAIKQAEKRGFEVDMDDWHDKVATGPKKPSSGKTNSFSINLMKDGKPSKKKLQMQVYNMDNQKYELNMYIEEVQQDVAEGYTDNDIETTRQFRNAIAGSKARSAIDKAKDGAGAKYYADGTKVTPQEIARRAAKRKPHLTKEGVVDEACWDTHKQVGMKKKGDRMVPDCRPKNEASSPAQQAAIAIAMKKAGKTPKDMEESDAYDKNVKPSDKPHDKDAAAKRAKLAALAARKKEIKEAEGGGTSISSSGDASTAVKRAQVLLKSTQLRLKHDKEREAMAKQKQALQKEEEDKEYPEVKTGGKPLAKKFEKAFAKMGIKTNIKMKTVGSTSINEKEDKKEENGKEAPAKQKAIKKGETLSGKQEPIKIDPEIESR